MTLTIVAIVQAAPGAETLLLAELQKLVAPTRAEAGCICYDLHTDNAVPGQFLFYELWQNRDLWQDHMTSAHIAAFRAATQGMIAGSALHEMTRLD